MKEEIKCYKVSSWIRLTGVAKWHFSLLKHGLADIALACNAELTKE
jgi:hypothetical protein